jgi:hypothetical protein
MTNSLERDGVIPGPAKRNSFSGSESAALESARKEALNIAQWLARIALCYVTDGDPARRIDLEFRAADAALVTKAFADSVALEMRFPDLRLQFLQHGKPVPHVFDPQERSPAEAEAWLLVELLHRGIDRERFSTNLPYAVSGLLTGDAEDYAPQACRDGLMELAEWFGKAAAALKETARAYGADKAAVICRPQSLDLALATLPGANTLPSLGFSLGDAQHALPYFYAAGEPTPGSAKVERKILSAAKLIAQGDIPQAAASLLRLVAG